MCQNYNEMEIAPKENAFLTLTLTLTLTVSPWEISAAPTQAKEHLEQTSMKYHAAIKNDYGGHYLLTWKDVHDV